MKYCKKIPYVYLARFRQIFVFGMILGFLYFGSNSIKVPQATAASLGAIIFPAVYEGAGPATYYDCTDRCGTGTGINPFGVYCDRNKCATCAWPAQTFKAILSADKTINLIIWHGCFNKNNNYCSSVPPDYDPRGCQETLFGSYSPSSLSFELSSGNGFGGEYDCSGSGKLSEDEISASAISCKTKKGQPGLDLPAGISLRRTSGDDSGASFSGVTGQVEWSTADKPDDWHLCKIDTIIPVGAHIRTQEDSSAILSFSDMTTFVLKPETEITLRTPSKEDHKVSLMSGNVWMNVKKAFTTGSMEVEMNQAVAGIKGTTFVVSDNDKLSTLSVIDGKVLFTSKSNGEKVNVVGGSMVSASSAGLSNIKSFNVAKETADWEAVSNSAKGTGVQSSKGAGDFKSKKLLFLYVLIGILAIFILIGGIRKIKNIKNRP